MALPLGTDVEFLGENSSGGMTVGKLAATLVSLHGATPVAQAAIATAVISASGAQVSALSTGEYATIVTTVNAIRTLLINKGFMASS